MSYFNETMSYFNKIRFSNGLIQKTTTVGKTTRDHQKCNQLLCRAILQHPKPSRSPTDPECASCVVF